MTVKKVSIWKREVSFWITEDGKVVYFLFGLKKKLVSEPFSVLSLMKIFVW